MNKRTNRSGLMFTHVSDWRLWVVVGGLALSVTVWPGTAVIKALILLALFAGVPSGLLLGSHPKPGLPVVILLFILFTVVLLLVVVSPPFRNLIFIWLWLVIATIPLLLIDFAYFGPFRRTWRYLVQRSATLLVVLWAIFSLLALVMLHTVWYVGIQSVEAGISNVFLSIGSGDTFEVGEAHFIDTPSLPTMMQLTGYFVIPLPLRGPMPADMDAFFNYWSEQALDAEDDTPAEIIGELLGWPSYLNWLTTNLLAWFLVLFWAVDGAKSNVFDGQAPESIVEPLWPIS